MKVVGGSRRCFCLLLLLLNTSVLIFVIFQDGGQQGTLPISGVIPKGDLNFPKTKEVITFHFFDDRKVYSVNTETVSMQSKEIKQLISNAKIFTASYLNTSANNFKYGQYRLLAAGVEFDLYFDISSDFGYKRVTSLIPLASPKCISEHKEGSVMETIHIVLPLQGKLKSLAAFADNIVNKIYPADDKITLTIVYLHDKREREAKAMLQEKFAFIPNFNWTFLPSNESKFSRGLGIKLGVNYIGRHSTDLLFFCDVDIIMRPEFLGRCRTNAIHGRQVYYPIVFSLYNPNLVYGNDLLKPWKPSNKAPLEVGRENGFWRNFGYGMVCLYTGDFESVGGIPDIRSWGGEDEILFKKFSHKKNIKYIRTPDPDLFHIYHRKDCHNVSMLGKKSCLKSKVLTEGSQLHMGLALFKLHEDIDVATVLIPEYHDLYNVVLVVSLSVSIGLNLFLSMWILKSFWGAKTV